MSKSSNAALQTRREAAVPRGVSTNQPVFAARAENGEIWDVEGKRYIDFASGIAVLATGHRHPKVVAAAKAQLDDFAHVCVQVTPYEPYIRLAERLNALMPGPGPKKSLFLNSGAEAVENAVKIARIATGRPAVVAFNGAFHGRTLLTVALTGKVAPYKLGIAPLPGEIYHVPFPDAYHGVRVEQSLKAIDALFRADVDPNRVCAFIVEPVQGEGGFNPVPPEFMQALRKICDTHGILLIVDEIQTGFGRTGKLFAVEHTGVAPDLMTVAKSLGGGFPISGVVGKAEIMDKPNVGAVGGTYGGHPMSCAAALAVLDVIDEEKQDHRRDHRRSLAGDGGEEPVLLHRRHSRPGRDAGDGTGQGSRHPRARSRPDQGAGRQGGGEGAGGADLRRLRQRGALPARPDHAGRAGEGGYGHPGGRPFRTGRLSRSPNRPLARGRMTSNPALPETGPEIFSGPVFCSPSGAFSAFRPHGGGESAGCVRTRQTNRI